MSTVKAARRSKAASFGPYHAAIASRASRLARGLDATRLDVARRRDGVARGDVLLDVLHGAVDLLEQAALLAVVDARLVGHAVEARHRAGKLVVLAQLALVDRLQVAAVLDDVGREQDEQVGLLLGARRGLEQV